MRTGAIDQNTGQIGGIIGAFLPTQERAQNSAGSKTLGLYVHVPFCAHRCGYCDFTLVAGK